MYEQTDVFRVMNEAGIVIDVLELTQVVRSDEGEVLETYSHLRTPDWKAVTALDDGTYEITRTGFRGRRLA